MKRSLLITIVVLLMAALFVSCNANKVTEDQIVEVTFSADAARGLNAEGAVNINVADLYWYYTAKKTSGLFRAGQQLTLAPVKASGTGFTDVSFALSTGGWEFCFYGFADPADAAAANPVTTAVLYQAGLRRTITESVAIDITLERGQKELSSNITFTNIKWDVNPAIEQGENAADVYALMQNLSLEVAVATTTNQQVTYSNLVSYDGVYDNTTGIALFSGTYPLTGTGTQDIVFSVYNTYTDNGITKKDKVGEETLTLLVSGGIQYIVSNTGYGIGIVADTQTVTVTPGTITQPQSEIKGFTVESNGPTQVQAAGTTVSFPETSGLSGNHTLSVETTPRATVENNTNDFTVGAGTSAVAAIDLTLDNDASGTEFDDIVTVTTQIEAGLPADSIKVFYNGSETFTIGQETKKYFVDYDPSDGTLIFQTNHFSQYVIAINCVATIGDKAYASLVDAVADAPDGAVVELQKDVSLGKINANDNVAISVEKNLTIDGNGYTLTTTAGRGIWVDASDVTLTIKNLTITGGSSLERAVQVNEGFVNVVLNIENCSLTSKYYAINLCSATEVYLNVKDSTVSGWAALNVWSNNLEAKVENCNLIGNTISANERFAVICMEGDTTGRTTDHSSNCTVEIIGGTIVASGKYQAVFGFNAQSEGNTIKATDVTITTEDVYYDHGTGNNLIVDSCTINQERKSFHTFDWTPVTFDTTGIIIDSEGTTATGVLVVTYAGADLSLELSSVTPEAWTSGSMSGNDYVFDFTLDGCNLYIDLDISVSGYENEGGFHIYTGQYV